MKEQYNKPIQHGELILKPVKHIPRGGKAVVLDMFVGADSHAGHHHVLNSKDMRITNNAGLVYIRVTNEGTIVHQKQTDNHKTLPLPIGKYQILRKTEYDPFEKVIRDVED